MCTYICSVNKQQQYLTHSIMKKLAALAEKLNTFLETLGSAASYSMKR